MLFWGGRRVVLKRCGCGLYAGASRLLGGKGLGGGPDETEKLSFSLTYTLMYRKHVVLIFTAGLTRSLKILLQPSNLVAFKK